MNTLRKFILIENYPLYVMLGFAGTMAVLTSYRHIKSDPEISVLSSSRSYEPMLGKIDENGENPDKNYFAGIFGCIYKTYHRYTNLNESK